MVCNDCNENEEAIEEVDEVGRVDEIGRVDEADNSDTLWRGWFRARAGMFWYGDRVLDAIAFVAVRNAVW